MINLKTIVLIILLLFSFHKLNSQDKKSFYLVHSAGYEFDNGNVPLYFSLKKSISSRAFIGLGAGVVENHKSAIDAVYDFLSPVYPSLNTGSYMMDLQFNTFGSAWIVNASLDYKILNNFYAGLGAGAIANKRNTYRTILHFYKAFQDQPLVVENAGDVYEKNGEAIMIRAYFRVDLNYNYKSILAGAYVDNLYSAGLNFGIGF